MIKNVPDRDYYIIFKEFKFGVPSFLWSIIIWMFVWRHPAYGHIDILYEENNTSTCITITPWQIGIQHSTIPIEDLIKVKNFSTTSIIKFKSITQNDNKIQRGILNCVSGAKAILGIRGLFIITPYQLYKKILKLGGKELWQR